MQPGVQQQQQTTTHTTMMTNISIMAIHTARAFIEAAEK